MDDKILYHRDRIAKLKSEKGLEDDIHHHRVQIAKIELERGNKLSNELEWALKIQTAKLETEKGNELSYELKRAIFRHYGINLLPKSTL